MAGSQGNGWRRRTATAKPSRTDSCRRKACRQTAHGAKSEHTPAKKLVQFSSGLSRPFIQRPVMTMLLTASIIVFGILTYNQLAVNDLPAVDYPVIQVRPPIRARTRKRWRTRSPRPWRNSLPRFPGSSSNDAARALRATPRSLCSSTSAKGSMPPRPTCSPPSNAPPANCRAIFRSPPTFTKTNPNDQPVMYIALTSDTLTDGELYRYGTTEVSQRINILPGVSAGQHLWGQGRDPDQSRSRRARRPQHDLRRICRPRSAPAPLTPARASSTARTNRSPFGLTGQIDERRRLSQPDRQAERQQRLARLSARRGPGHRRRRERAALAPLFCAWFHPPASVIVFAVSRQAGANAVAVARSVRALLPELASELPGSIRLIPTFDRSQSIVNSLHDVQATLAIAFALVIFVIFVFLGRASDTLIPMVALPMSFLITFIAMWCVRFLDQ